MRRSKETRWWKANLRGAFGAEPPHLDAYVLRLVVLYEDLRLELAGVVANELKALEAVGQESRKQYFIRRATATAVEFAEAFRLLDGLDAFAAVRLRFSPEDAARWSEAVRFLGAQEPYLELIRNDIGGHFGLKAAMYALQNLNPGAEGYIKVQLDHGNERAAIWYEFAGEVAATAMSRHKPKDEGTAPFFERVFALLSECFDRAISATDLLNSYCLLGRFH